MISSNKMTRISRNNNMDSLKAICSIVIVLLHVWTPYSQYYNALTRCAVPCFFMISGYLNYSDSYDKLRIRHRILRMLKILVVSTLIYIPFYLLDQITYRQYSTLSLESIYRFVLFNENPFGFHLWYIAAYVYVLISSIIVTKWQLWTPALVVSLILVFIGLGLSEFSNITTGIVLPNYMTRNFIFIGIPSYYIGAHIKINSKFIEHLKTNRVVVFLAIVIIAAIVEPLLLSKIIGGLSTDEFITSYVLAATMLILAIKSPSSKNVLSEMGHKYSLYIYIIHFGLINAITYSISFAPTIIVRVYTYLAPLVIFVVAYFLSYTFGKTKV